MKQRHTLRVLRAMQEPKVSQNQLARRAGLRNESRYWHIEHGEGYEPTEDEKRGIAAALGVKVTDIAWPELVTRTEQAS